MSCPLAPQCRGAFLPEFYRQHFLPLWVLSRAILFRALPLRFWRTLPFLICTCSPVRPLALASGLALFLPLSRSATIRASGFSSLSGRPVYPGRSLRISSNWIELIGRFALVGTPLCGGSHFLPLRVASFWLLPHFCSGAFVVRGAAEVVRVGTFSGFGGVVGRYTSDQASRAVAPRSKPPSWSYGSGFFFDPFPPNVCLLGTGLCPFASPTVMLLFSTLASFLPFCSRL